ncbi:MAG: hypothetical protein C0497_03585 [Gemmatimonas sp.]|nr:hypothetical protein [Gemmatimonas sp.]
MLVELIDRLRCPHVHEDSWLVAAVSRAEHRRLVDATLGCPVCNAEFEVRGGVVSFGEATPSAPMPATDDEVLRAAALLHVEERGLYLLDAAWGSLAPGLLVLITAEYLLVDPPAGITAADGAGILSGVGDRWPLAGASLHGIAMDRATSARLADALRILRAGGRLVAPASAVLPAGARELARDERHWVAEKAGDVITLSRAQRQM